MLLPGVANAMTARIAEDAGYEALYVTGAGVSNFVLGVPDVGLITQRDVVDAVMAIADVVDLPLIVDADTGFGNAVNTYHTVRRLEAAGASAIQLEDQVFPKKCGHFSGKEIVSTREMADKIRAAVDARRDHNTQIIARTDASRLGVPSVPRKYFETTMLVAVCDQALGISTSRCSNAGPSLPGISASRNSHSISSNGSRPGIVK